MSTTIRVFYLEDEPDDVGLIRDTFQYFQNPRVELVTASSVEAAKPILVEEFFDLIIADVVLAGSECTGLELVRSLLSQGCRVPTLLVTQHDELPLTDADMEFMSDGRFEFLHKNEFRERTFRYWLQDVLSRPIEILFLEDDEDDQLLVAEYLSESPFYQFRLQTASTLEEAYVLLGARNFDLYLLDYNLPDGKGMAFADEILTRHPHAPITLVTGDERFGQSRQELSALGDRRVYFLSKNRMSPTSLVRALLASRNTPLHL